MDDRVMLEEGQVRSRKAFCLHMKPGDEDAVPLGLASNEIIIGWPDAVGLLDPLLDWKGFRDVVHQAYFPSSPTKHSAASHASSLWLFIRRMKAGDYVVVPHGKHEFYLAMVIGDPYYHPEPSSGRYRRPVHWLNGNRPYSRSAAPGALQHVLGLRRTCQDATYWLEVIETFLQSNGAELDASELVVDLAAIAKSPKRDGGTSTKTLVDARLGQGQFRADVLASWGNACAVTGCRLVAAIRASHLKPWRSCTDDERLDPCNGLPLLATLDALFDRGLISFEANGGMLVSRHVPSQERCLLGLPNSLRRPLSPGELDFLEFHRKIIFQGT